MSNIGASMKDSLKPEIYISSFNEKDVRDYIDKLNTLEEAFGYTQPILIHIDSFGGSVYGLIMLYEHLVSMGNPIVTYTTSKAMSAGAFLLSMAGTPGMRYASPNASIMIHELQSAVFPDDLKNIENNVDNLKKINDNILGILAKSMGLRSAKDIRNLIKEKSVGHDLNLSAKEAKELNMIDHVGYVKIMPVVAYNIVQLNPEDVALKNKSTKNKLTK